MVLFSCCCCCCCCCWFWFWFWFCVEARNDPPTIPPRAPLLHTILFVKEFMQCCAIRSRILDWSASGPNWWSAEESPDMYRNSLLQALIYNGHLVGALYSNMDWWWLANIFSREQGIGSLHSRSWFSALSASSLKRKSRTIKGYKMAFQLAS